MVYVGIPIGTDCALLLTDLVIHAKESDFIQGLLRISSNNSALPAYYISQFTRYSRVFVQYSGFLDRTGLLKQNLLKQGLFLDRCKKLYGPPLLK